MVESKQLILHFKANISSKMPQKKSVINIKLLHTDWRFYQKGNHIYLITNNSLLINQLYLEVFNVKVSYLNCKINFTKFTIT